MPSLNPVVVTEKSIDFGVGIFYLPCLLYTTDNSVKRDFFTMTTEIGGNQGVKGDCIWNARWETDEDIFSAA